MPNLTPDDLQTIREIVRHENLQLADAVADCLAKFFQPLANDLTECVASLRQLLDGQVYLEKLTAHLSDNPPGDSEPWRDSLRPDEQIH